MFWIFMLILFVLPIVLALDLLCIFTKKEPVTVIEFIVCFLMICIPIFNWIIVCRFYNNILNRDSERELFRKYSWFKFLLKEIKL